MVRLDSYKALKKQFGYCEGLVGTNEDGETVIVTIDKENATVQTIQKNGWTRVNVYWKDGTIEESYRR